MEERPPAQTKAPGEHRTIGFLTAYIHIDVSRRLWRGVIDAAARHNINVVCYPGGGLYTETEFEAQRNVIYDLVNPAGLDGLISWSSTITGSLDPADIRAFLQRYRPLPMVCLTQPVQDMPTLSVDTYQGMREAIVHLIEVHGYRRIAFIRGPAEHYYAQERYRAYLDVLASYDIPFAAKLVTPHLDWGMNERRLDVTSAPAIARAPSAPRSASLTICPSRGPAVASTRSSSTAISDA